MAVYRRSLRFNAVTKVLNLVTDASSDLMRIVLYAVLLTGYGSLVQAGYGVGNVTTLVLQVRLLNRGLKMVVTACDRFAASMGSVERVVQLAQSGTMPPPAKPDRRTAQINLVSDLTLGSDGCVRCCVPSFAADAGVLAMTAPSAEMDASRALNGHLQVRGLDLLSHRHKGVLALRGIDFSLRPGEMVVVDGPPSSGKTALLLVCQLLARPNKGEVRFGFGDASSAPDRGLEKVNELTHDYESIRKQLGVVSSLSQQLFRTTLEANLCVGAHAAVSVEEMKQACAKLGILDSIMALRSGFQTTVGDSSGVSFSKSEMNQLMLVRALVRKPRLLLLDDAERHLTAEARKCFMSTIAELRKDGVGVLIASQHAEVREAASRIVSLSEDGRMVAEGPPELAV